MGRIRRTTGRTCYRCQMEMVLRGTFDDIHYLCQKCGTKIKAGKSDGDSVYRG